MRPPRAALLLGLLALSPAAAAQHGGRRRHAAPMPSPAPRAGASRARSSSAAARATPRRAGSRGCTWPGVTAARRATARPRRSSWSVPGRCTATRAVSGSTPSGRSPAQRRDPRLRARVQLRVRGPGDAPARGGPRGGQRRPRSPLRPRQRPRLLRARARAARRRAAARSRRAAVEHIGRACDLGGSVACFEMTLERWDQELLRARREAVSPERLLATAPLSALRRAATRAPGASPPSRPTPDAPARRRGARSDDAPPRRGSAREREL